MIILLFYSLSNIKSKYLFKNYELYFKKYYLFWLNVEINDKYVFFFFEYILLNVNDGNFFREFNYCKFIKLR